MSDLVVIKPEVADPEQEQEEGPVTHIVKTPKDVSAHAYILQARIEGTPVEALCGFVWVPTRDPQRYPLCQACKEVHDVYRSFNPHLNDPTA